MASEVSIPQDFRQDTTIPVSDDNVNEAGKLLRKRLYIGPDKSGWFRLCDRIPKPNVLIEVIDSRGRVHECSAEDLGSDDSLTFYDCEEEAIVDVVFWRSSRAD